MPTFEDFSFDDEVISPSRSKKFHLEDDNLEEVAFERSPWDLEEEKKSKKKIKSKSSTRFGFEEEKEKIFRSNYEKCLADANSGRYPSLKDHEVIAYVLLAQAGDEHSMNMLIKHNYLYINKKLLDHPMVGHKVIFEDAFSNRDSVWNDGCLGFAEAVRHFDRTLIATLDDDPTYSAQFKALLYNLAGGVTGDPFSFRKSYIYKYVSQSQSYEQFGLNQDNALKKKALDDMTEKLRAELNREPTVEEIQARHKKIKGSGIGQSRVIGLKNHTTDYISLNQTTGDEEKRELGEVIPATFVSPDAHIVEEETRLKVEQLYENIPAPPKGRILGKKHKMLSGIGGHDVRNPQEAGRLFGGGGDRVKSEKFLIDRVLQGEVATYDPEVYEVVVKDDGTTEKKFSRVYRNAYPEHKKSLKNSL